ncbi:unnamed protein product, partial [Closterium sp. NIES-53]
VDPLPGTAPVQVAVVSGAAPGAASGGAVSGGAEPGGAGSEGARSGGAEPEGVEHGGAQSEGAEPEGAESEGAESGGAEPRGTTSSRGPADASSRLSSQQLREWLVRCAHCRSEAPGARKPRGTGAGAAAVTTRVGDPTEPGVAGVGGLGADGSGGAGARAVDLAARGAGGIVRPRSYFIPLLQQSGGLTERRELASRTVLPVCTARRAPHSRPPPVLGTHAMALRPSSVPLRVPLRAPLESSLPAVPVPESDRARAASPTVARLLATSVTDPSIESAAASALVAGLLDFAAACRLNYAFALDRLEDFECLAAAVPRFASLLLAPEGDLDAPDIPTPRSYAEAITGPYSSQWQAAMDAEMASWKSTGTYVDEVPPPGVNIVDGMWIFRVKRPPGSPPAFKARYVARGLRQRQGVDNFQTFSPTPKMTTLRVLLHVAAQRDNELHSLDFITSFLQGSLHKEIWLRRPLVSLGRFLQVPSSTFGRVCGAECLLARYVAPGMHRKVHWDAAKRVLRYLCSTLGMGLVLGGRGPVVLTGHADASWVDDSATQRSSQGYNFSLGSGSVSCRSTRSSSVLSSSCEAEIYAGAMVAQDLRWLTYLLIDLGEQPRSPPVLYVDNKAMIALCQEHRLEHRTKHIALRYFLARELQQRGQLRLAYVATRANTADVFTKALPPGDHQRFVTMLGLAIVGLALGGTNFSRHSTCTPSLFLVHLFSPTILTATAASTAAPTYYTAMASLRVLAFDHEGRPVQFDTWLDDLQLYLLSDSKVRVSLFYLASGAATAPPATADSSTRSQWLTRDAAARLAIHNHLPLAKCAHFGQHRTAQALYDVVVVRYSSLATAALGRLLLPYLFPELSAFATVEDLVSHLRASDTRYRDAVPAEFLDRNPPPMYITLYFIVTRLPESLHSVRDPFLSLDPTSLTFDLLEQHLLAAETSALSVGAACGTPRPPFSEGLLLLVRSAAAARARVAGVVVVAAAVVEVAAGVVEGAAVEVVAAVGVVAGVVAGVGALVAAVEAVVGVAAAEAVGLVAVRLTLGVSVLGVASVSSSSVGARPCLPSSFTCGRLHTQHRCFSRLDDAWRAEFGDDVLLPHWADLLRSRIAIFDLDFYAILSAKYALSVSAEGDCYQCVPPDPGIAAAALGASESGTLLGTAPAQPLHTFTIDKGASRGFFRDSTTLTPLPTPVPVRLADPSGGPVVARSSTVLPCPAVPSGSLSGLHLPSFSTNLVSTAALQDAMVTTTTPGGQRVSICTCTWTGRHLATFTRRPWSSLYTLSTEPPQTLLWHHRLVHPSLPRLRCMQSRLLLSSLPRSLPPQPLVPAPPCLPCVEGRQHAAPHSSLFPLTSAPMQTLHMDMWGPARITGQSRKRYFLLVVNNYTWYTTVFPLRSKGQDLLVLPLHSDRGGEFSSNLLREFCRGEGILQSFTLPDSPQLCGIAERRIGLVMEVARTSMIHAAAPHFLWPFAVQYTAHQLNFWPRVSLPETSPTLRWMGEVGDASVFQVWGSRVFFRDTSADMLSPCAIPCVFLGFVPDAPRWHFYHPTSCRVLLSYDVTFDESVPFYRLFPYRSTPPPPQPLFLAPGPPLVDPLPPQGPAPSGVSQVDPLSCPVPVQVAVSSGAARGAASRGAEPGGVGTRGDEPEGAEPEGSAAASTRLSLQQLREWFLRRARLRSGSTGAGGVGVAGAGGAGVAAGASGARAAVASGPGGARTRETGAAGPGGVEGAGVVGPGAGGAGAAGAGVGGIGAGGTGAVDPCAGGAGGTVRPRPYFVPLLQHSQPPLQPVSPLPAPSPYTEQSGGLTEHREPASRCVSPIHTARRAPRSRPPPVPGTHAMAHCPSSVPLRVPLPAPPTSSLLEVPDPESDRTRAASPTVSCLLATAVTHPSFEFAAASALVAELLDFAAACRLDYDIALVAESASASPPSVGGECALCTDVLEERQEDYESHAAVVPRTYVDDVPPPGANIVDGMWIFRVKQPPGSPPAFKARYIARGYSQRQGVDYFQTFSPNPKRTTLQVLLLVAAQCDYELHSLEFSTAFLQVSLHEEIWLRRPPGFTGTFPASTQWSLRRPVYGLRQAPCEWHDTLRTTLAALGFAPSTADPSLFLRTDTSLLPFYVLV